MVIVVFVDGAQAISQMVLTSSPSALNSCLQNQGVTINMCSLLNHVWEMAHVDKSIKTEIHAAERWAMNDVLRANQNKKVYVLFVLSQKAQKAANKR